MSAPRRSGNSVAAIGCGSAALRSLLACCLFGALVAADAVPQRDGGGRIDGWVPEGVAVVRGIWFDDGARWIDDWHEVLTLWGYAHLRGAMHSYQGDKDAAIRAAIASLAERSGHPELVHAPLFASGYSRFSGNADSLANRFPGRVLSYASGFDPRHPPTSEAMRIPNVKIATEVEDIFTGDRNRRKFGDPWTRDGRPLRAFCPQWREIHSFSTITPFLMAYWDQIQRLRVPADWDPRSGPPALRMIAEDEGWLGDTTGFWTPPETPAPDDPLIAPVADFPAERRARAAWLPDRETAWLWRAWTSRSPWGAFISPCRPWEQGAGHHRALGLRVGAPVTLRVRVTVPDAQKVEAWAWCAPIGATDRIEGGVMGSTKDGVATLTWTPSESRVVPLLVRITRAGGAVGWITPVVVPIHPAR